MDVCMCYLVETSPFHWLFVDQMMALAFDFCGSLANCAPAGAWGRNPLAVAFWVVSEICPQNIPVLASRRFGWLGGRRTFRIRVFRRYSNTENEFLAESADERREREREREKARRVGHPTSTSPPPAITVFPTSGWLDRKRWLAEFVTFTRRPGWPPATGGNTPTP